MARSRREKVAALLERHGQTYAEELGIDVRRGTPAPLFQLLVASLLFSARINTSIAVEAAKAVRRDGWTTARRLAESSWERRAKVLNEAGYARYDERTATMLGDTAALLLREYGGDLRRLRDAAGRDPDEERRRLKRFKGIGDVGVDIFFREVQVAWDELRPFFDRRALETAERLGLGKDAPALARLVDDADVARLATALVRARQAGDLDELA